MLFALRNLLKNPSQLRFFCEGPMSLRKSAEEGAGLEKGYVTELGPNLCSV